jgi:hypothetical protein
MSRKILLILAILLATASVFAIRSNQRQARLQATAIMASDLSGEVVTTQLAQLKAYSQSHLSSSSAVTLTGSYTRAQAAATAAAAAADTSAAVYAAAQKACSGQSDSIVQARCNAQYLSTHLSSIPATTPVPIPQPTAYQYHFTSPFWTPDLAGVLTIATILVGGLWIFISFGRRRVQ